MTSPMTCALPRDSIYRWVERKGFPAHKIGSWVRQEGTCSDTVVGTGVRQ